MDKKFYRALCSKCGGEIKTSNTLHWLKPCYVGGKHCQDCDCYIKDDSDDSFFILWGRYERETPFVWYNPLTWRSLYVWVTTLDNRR